MWPCAQADWEVEERRKLWVSEGYLNGVQRQQAGSGSGRRLDRQQAARRIQRRQHAQHHRRHLFQPERRAPEQEQTPWVHTPRPAEQRLMQHLLVRGCPPAALPNCRGHQARAASYEQRVMSHRLLLCVPLQHDHITMRSVTISRCAGAMVGSRHSHLSYQCSSTCRLWYSASTRAPSCWAFRLARSHSRSCTSSPAGAVPCHIE